MAERERMGGDDEAAEEPIEEETVPAEESKAAEEKKAKEAAEAEEEEDDENEGVSKKDYKAVVENAGERVLAATGMESAKPEILSKSEKFWSYVLDKPSVFKASGIVVAGIISSLYKFTKELIVKKGNIGFSRGFDIGYGAPKKGKK